MKKFLLIAVYIIAGIACGYSQQVGTGQWDIHIPFGRGAAVCEGDGYIYVGTSTGMFSVKQSDQSIKRYSTVNGLSDVNITAIGYSNEAECLIMGYANGNIDLMKGSTIINIKDILNASSITQKRINDITIKGKRAYLACEFGIAVINLETEETPSYVIFTNTSGFELPVRQVAIANDGTILAASDAGLFHYSGLGAFQDFGAWVRYPNVFVGTYNAVVNHEGTLYASYSRYLSNGLYNQDTIYIYNGTSWQAWDSISGKTIRSMDTQNGKLTITIAPDSASFTGTVIVKNTDGSNHAFLVDDFVGDCTKAFTDTKGETWLAHGSLGVLRVFNYNKRNFYYPTGPFSAGAYRMKHNGKYLWVASGAMSPGFAPAYRIDGVFRLSNDNEWSTFNLLNMPLLSNSYDFLDIVTTDNPDQVYAIANSGAAYQINGNTVSAKYDSASTGGALVKAPLYNNILPTAGTLDANGALWMGMCYSPKPLAVKTPSGVWKSFTIPGITNSDAIVAITALRNGQVWIAVRGKGIYAIKHDNYNSISQIKSINTNNGTGSLPSNYVYCMAEDQDGEVWVGTENGFIIFYSPEAIFNNSSFNGTTPVVVASDGNNEKLLDGVFVYDICVDGGNRKWMATYGAGAYLMSKDGYTIEKHFLKSNSPLLSDNILSVTVHPEKGNVYFGTELGIISYRGDATEATDSFGEEVYAFPNPVRPENTGPITIAGLARDSELKITDISGQLIYQTTSNGGTAVWDGNNFNGVRAKTGTYLVFAANADGSEKIVTRILIIN